ncbi:MAG: hypothetical protein U0798_01150 [Gemmataceae bacterium]
MGLSFRCACGHVNDVIRMTTDRMAECSACGQTVYIARQQAGMRAPRIVLAIATLFATTTVALVVVLLMTMNTARELEQQAAQAKADALNPFINRNGAIPDAGEKKLQDKQQEKKDEHANPRPEQNRPDEKPPQGPIQKPDNLLPAPNADPMPNPATKPQPNSEPPPLPAPPPPTPNGDEKPLPREGVLKPAIVEPAGRYRLGETIDQEVIVTRRSAIRIAGNEIGQNGQYALGSRIAIVKINADGSFVAEQTIQSTRLIECDTDLKDELKAALEKAKGAKFELTIKANGEVQSISGIKDPVQVKAGMDAVGQSLRLWSLLDTDAWKELAGIAFFQPEKPLKKGASWSKAVEHDWGELGHWKGKTNYLDRGPVASSSPLERIDYAHMLRYSLPAAGAKSTLPIAISKAEFSVIAANGAVLYHSESKRARSAEENFRVRGNLLVTFAGSEVAVEMEEHQHFKLSMSEPEPRNLVGRPQPK